MASRILVSIEPVGVIDLPEGGMVRIAVKAMTAHEAVMKTIKMLEKPSEIRCIDAFDEDTGVTAFRNDENNGWKIDIDGNESGGAVRFTVYDWRIE